jgi:hypothetical protein
MWLSASVASVGEKMIGTLDPNEAEAIMGQR